MQRYRPYLEKYPTLPVSVFAMLASVGFWALLFAVTGVAGGLWLAQYPFRRFG